MSTDTFEFVTTGGTDIWHHSSTDTVNPNQWDQGNDVYVPGATGDDDVLPGGYGNDSYYGNPTATYDENALIPEVQDAMDEIVSDNWFFEI